MNHELLEYISAEYGHAYIPEFYDGDVEDCARVWAQTKQGQDYLEIYYPDSASVSYTKIAEDFEDLITDWLELELEAWKNAQ